MSRITTIPIRASDFDKFREQALAEAHRLCRDLSISYQACGILDEPRVHSETHNNHVMILVEGKPWAKFRFVQYPQIPCCFIGLQEFPGGRAPMALFNLRLTCGPHPAG